MADGDSVSGAGSEEQKKLEILAVEILCGFIETVQARQADKTEPLQVGDLNAAMAEMINNGLIAKIARVALAGIGKELEGRWARHLRKDPFGRILFRPLSELLAEDKIPRTVHHGVRHFARLILGEELEQALVHEAEDLAKKCAGDGGVDWDRFYRLAQPIWWQFAVRLPAAFRHFDARLNHMVSILNMRSGQISLSANVVVRTGKPASTDIVGPAQARLMLDAWLKSVEVLEDADRAKMAAATGLVPSFEELRAELDDGY
ncbi:MAG: hypothetical protein ACK5U4_02370 [Rhodospirillales bacterium]|jgi:hypothetical protein|nr:hypothetical protein [Magnetospirillum sp.]